jgi:hypothetical protein
MTTSSKRKRSRRRRAREFKFMVSNADRVAYVLLYPEKVQEIMHWAMLEKFPAAAIIEPGVVDQWREERGKRKVEEAVRRLKIQRVKEIGRRG